MTTLPFELGWTSTAEGQVRSIEKDRNKAGLIKQIKKALRHLIENPSHPGLKTHPMKNLEAVYGEKIFSSYAQNNTPQAHRILWYYGPKAQQITIAAIIPHY